MVSLGLGFAFSLSRGFSCRSALGEELLFPSSHRLLGFAFGVCEALLVGIVITAIAAALLRTYGGLHPDFAEADAIDRTYIAKLLLRFVPR